MDISVIDASKVTKENGLMIGQDDAPVKIVEFMNVRCPYCKKWFEDSYELLTTYVLEGKVQRVIKLFDKEKPSLQAGNVMHHHVNYDLPEKGLTDIRQMYVTQDQWGNLPLEKVAEFTEQNLGLKEMKNQKIIDHVLQETNAANIKFIPTIIIGSTIFDESISITELEKLLNS